MNNLEQSLEAFDCLLNGMSESELKIFVSEIESKKIKITGKYCGVKRQLDVRIAAEKIVDEFQCDTPPTMECMPKKAAIQCAIIHQQRLISKLEKNYKWVESNYTIFSEEIRYEKFVLAELRKMQ